MTRYELLHYRGDLTATAQIGALLGCDEMGRPYEITDVEYQSEVDTTTVFLEYASVEAMKAAAR